MQKVRENTKIHGRIELLRKDPCLIHDVAHNIDAIKRLVETLAPFDFNKVFLIFGIMKDKAYHEVIKTLSGLANVGYAVQPEGLRALDSGIIQEDCRKTICRQKI